MDLAMAWKRRTPNRLTVEDKRFESILKSKPGLVFGKRRQETKRKERKKDGYASMPSNKSSFAGNISESRTTIKSMLRFDSIDFTNCKMPVECH